MYNCMNAVSAEAYISMLWHRSNFTGVLTSIAQLSQRDCAAGWVSCGQKWKTIFCGQYRSISNHRDVIGKQSYRIQWNKAI